MPGKQGQRWSLSLLILEMVLSLSFAQLHLKTVPSLKYGPRRLCWMPTAFRISSWFWCLLFLQALRRSKVYLQKGRALLKPTCPSSPRVRQLQVVGAWKNRKEPPLVRERLFLSGPLKSLTGIQKRQWGRTTETCLSFLFSQQAHAQNNSGC